MLRWLSCYVKGQRNHLNPCLVGGTFGSASHVNWGVSAGFPSFLKFRFFLSCSFFHSFCPPLLSMKFSVDKSSSQSSCLYLSNAGITIPAFSPFSMWVIPRGLFLLGLHPWELLADHVYILFLLFLLSDLRTQRVKQLSLGWYSLKFPSKFYWWPWWGWVHPVSMATINVIVCLQSDNDHDETGSILFFYGDHHAVVLVCCFLGNCGKIELILSSDVEVGLAQSFHGDPNEAGLVHGFHGDHDVFLCWLSFSFIYPQNIPRKKKCLLEIVPAFFILTVCCIWAERNTHWGFWTLRWYSSSL